MDLGARAPYKTLSSACLPPGEKSFTPWMTMDFGINLLRNQGLERKPNLPFPGGNCLSSEVKQKIVEMKEEIRGLRQNLTGGPAGNELFSDVKQQLAEIKQEIRALKVKGNETGGNRQFFFFFEKN